MNERYAEVVLSIYEEGDLVMIYDFELLLMSQALRKEFPDMKIGIWVSVPFPSTEIFRTLPCRGELLEGMLSCQLVGFNTFEYCMCK